MDIKILIAAHKLSWLPEDKCYLPIHVGAEGKKPLGYQGDNTGDNISLKNPYYCELTALYWAWKNLQTDYVGLVHYRRMFTRKEVRSIKAKQREVLDNNDWERLLSKCPIIVPDKRKYYIESNYNHYMHNHPHDGLLMTEAIIRVNYPEYMDAFDVVKNRTWAHMFNMFVMRKDLFDEYCEWMFSVLNDIEVRLKEKVQTWDAFEQRMYGRVSELLLDVWLEKKGIKYLEQNVSFMEKQNWIKKGGLFLKRKAFGRTV